MFSGNAGADLSIQEDVCLPYPGCIAKVGTGVRVQIPSGYVGLVVSRSSTPKYNVEVANNIGIIDSNYTGEIFLTLRNVASREACTILKGTYVAQLLIVPCVAPEEFIISGPHRIANHIREELGYGSTDEVE